MTKYFFILSLCAGSFLAAASIESEDSGMTDDYKLVDRNEAGLDWNRFNFPGPKQRYER